MYLTKDKASFPLEVEWSLLWDCNASCNFCSTSGFSSSVADYKQIAYEIIKCNPICVTLSGGEPLLHPNINEIIRLLSSCNIAVNLTTNGSHLNPQFIKPDVVSLINWTRVSVHSAISAESKKIMGNSYNIKQVESNILAHVSVNKNISLFSLVINEGSFQKNIPSVIALANRCNVRKLTIGELRMVGKVKGRCSGQAMPSGEQYDKLNKIAIRNGVVLEHPKPRGGDNNVCTTAATSLSVCPDGSVQTCCFSNKIVGRASEEGLNDIWNRICPPDFVCKQC